MSEGGKAWEKEQLQMAVIDRIQELLRERGWTLPELAAQAQVSVRTVHYVFQNKNITLYTLTCLCRGFGITLDSFFDVRFLKFTEEDDV